MDAAPTVKNKKSKFRKQDNLVRFDDATKARLSGFLDKPESGDPRVIVPWNMCHVDKCVTEKNAREMHRRFFSEVDLPFNEVKYTIMGVMTDKRAVSLVDCFASTNTSVSLIFSLVSTGHW